MTGTTHHPDVKSKHRQEGWQVSRYNAHALQIRSCENDVLTKLSPRPAIQPTRPAHDPMAVAIGRAPANAKHRPPA